MSNEFKVGDRVIVNGEQDLINFVTAKGVVVADSEELPPMIGVEFEMTDASMHSCKGAGIDKHCYYIYPSLIKRIEEKEKIGGEGKRKRYNDS